MKKTILFSLTVLLVIANPLAFAEENKASEATGKTLAAIDQQNKTTLVQEMQKTEIKMPPIATVKEEKKEIKPASKTAAVASVNLKEKKLVKTAPSTKTEKLKNISTQPLSADASDQSTKANWTNFFSENLTPDSVIYTVQPGDSLYIVANRNHTTVDLIKKMNGLKRDTIYIGMKLKIFKGTFSIVVNKSENVLTLLADEKPIKMYRISTGKKNSTPAGEFKIINKLVNPTWFKTGAIYPPGSPDNALGTRWLGFDLAAYGIHGTTEPENIGKAVSEGCIRMLNKDVEELYSMVPSGTQVTIKD